MTERPTEDEMLLAVAEVLRGRATCPRYGGVAALVSLRGRVLSTGYSGVPSELLHCTHDADQRCVEAVHAEANAVAFAARHGVSLEGSTMYTTLMPCLTCAQLVINAGIVRVVTTRPYRDQMGERLLEVAGIEISRYAKTEVVR